MDNANLIVTAIIAFVLGAWLMSSVLIEPKHFKTACEIIAKQKYTDPAVVKQFSKQEACIEMLGEFKK